jgi:predicted kinase
MSERDRWTIHMPTIVVMVLQAIGAVAIARFVAVPGLAPASDRTAVVATQARRAQDPKTEFSTAYSLTRDANTLAVRPLSTRVDVTQEK